MTIKQFYHRILTRYFNRIAPREDNPIVRTFQRGPCAKCGEIVPLRADGQPSRRWHACTVPLCPRCRAPKPCACEREAA